MSKFDILSKKLSIAGLSLIEVKSAYKRPTDLNCKYVIARGDMILDDCSNVAAYCDSLKEAEKHCNTLL